MNQDLLYEIDCKKLPEAFKVCRGTGNIIITLTADEWRLLRQIMDDKICKTSNVRN